nr:tetratricopeptide repeat protein [Polymorphobacter sp. PAMC 29334]
MTARLLPGVGYGKADLRSATSVCRSDLFVDIQESSAASRKRPFAVRRPRTKVGRMSACSLGRQEDIRREAIGVMHPFIEPSELLSCSLQGVSDRSWRAHGGGMVFTRVLIIAIAVAAAAGAAERPNAHDALQAAFTRANNNQADSMDCRAALATVNALLAMPAFTKGPVVDRTDAYTLGAWCSVQMHEPVAARRFALAGTSLTGASVDLWRMRLGIEEDNQQPLAAVTTIEAMVVAKSDALASITVNHFHAIRRSLDVLHDRAADRRLLAVLTTSSYVPDEGAPVADPFRSDYAALLAADGDRAAAAALVASITEPSVLLEVSVDPRLRDFLPREFDGRAATEQHLAQARDVAASHAGSMYAVLDVSRYLRMLGRYDEALATLAAARPDAPGAAFTDLDEQRNWYWDEMARLYERFGRYDEAVATFRKAIDAKEQGGFNVSQTINLGEAQIRFARNADALATMKSFAADDSISRYGEMELRLVRSCARLALGDAEAVKGDIGYMAAHERDSPELLTEVQLCAGDLDAAAALMIRRLDNPDQRVNALLHLSDYDRDPRTRRGVDHRVIGVRDGGAVENHWRGQSKQHASHRRRRH